MALSPTTIAILCGAFFFSYISWSRRKSLKFLRGPPSPSWLLGHEYDLSHQLETEKAQTAWFREYGTVFRSSGAFGEDVLHVADPKALVHILHTASYHYPKTKDVRTIIRRLNGKGILWAEGEIHQKQRKVLNPAFSASQLKTFLSLFQRSAKRLTEKWNSQLDPSNKTKVLDVSKWLPRVTLDVIGESAFDYKFGALDDEENILAKILLHLFDDSSRHTKWGMLYRALRRHLADFMAESTVEPDNLAIVTNEDKRFNEWLEASQQAARDILAEKAGSVNADTNDKDILSVLVRSNAQEDPNKRLADYEVLSQMATLIIAGHETTASTMTWFLYELARNPKDQQRIRDEIANVRARKVDQDEAFGPNDYDESSMPFFNAALKEVLRLYPIVVNLQRCADRDDVIPLSEPLTTISGEQISTIPIAKGQRIIIDIMNYNRLKNLWGEDADHWNPSRFLEIKKGTTLGVYANLLTFSAGVRACIGWRFALLEMQAIIIELIESFEMRDENLDIFKAQVGVTAPMVRGRLHEGVQMPLKVSIL